MSEAPATNPYVGPRTFGREQAHLFFGRDQEARDLLARVVSERLLLFYAQSGAGKSSLINARLVPGLQAEGFAVLPISRVSGDFPAGAGPVDNIYLANLMTSLDQGPAPLKVEGVTLSDFLAHLATEDGQHWEYQPTALLPEAAGSSRSSQRFVLVIDQFEEIITTHPERWPEREDFFRQLNRALLDDPNLWAVLTLREDYVAALDPYAPAVFNRLRARFYMERMGVDSALDAVRRPAELAGRPFAPGVAEQLVDNLRQVRVPGQEAMVPGPYVEPVQLQVVCYELWQSLEGQHPGPITAADLQQAGDVNQALMRFYEAALPQVRAETGLSERSLRRWVDSVLITPAHTRGLAYRGADDTAGLPNAGADLLSNAFLVRPVVRGGDTWYELSHDRLVEPILDSNRRWQAAYENPISQPAAEWQRSGRPAAKLLDGRQLNEARDFAAANPGELTEEEDAFLTASIDAYDAARRRRLAVLAGVVAVAVLGLLAAWALWSRGQAQEQEDLASSRQLAAAAIGNLEVDPELSALLAIAATDRASTNEAAAALHGALQDMRVLEVFAGQEGTVYDVAVSPDGSLLATGGADGTVRLWPLAANPGQDPASPPATTVLPVEGPVWGLAFSPDGALLAAASRGGSAFLFDVATGVELARLAHPAGVLDVAFGPDGMQLATGGEDGWARVWHLLRNADATLTHGEPTVIGEEGLGSVLGVAFSPDSTTLATASGNLIPDTAEGVAKLWNVESGMEMLPLLGHTDTVEAIAFSPDGSQVATGSWDETARVWDALSGQQLLVLPGHTSWVRGVAFSPDGHRLATGSWDRRAKVWDLASGQEQFTLAGHTGYLKGVAFTPDGRQLVTASEDSTARLWHAGPTEELLTLVAHDGAKIDAVAFNPAGTGMVTAGGDGTARLWALTQASDTTMASATDLGRLPHAAAVSDAVFSADGSLIATASEDRTARLWWVVPDASGTPAAAEPSSFIADHPVPVTAVAISPDNSLVATAAPDSLVRLWDVSSGRPAATLAGHQFRINSVAFSPDGTLVASAGGDHTARLWDVRTGQELRRLEGHTDEVYQLAFSRDGQRLATASVDQTARVWDVATGQELLVLAGHGDRVESVAFGPDGTQLATASWDRKARLWDATTGALQQVLGGHDSRVLDLAFGPAGSILATAGQDGTVRLYLVKDSDLVALAQSRLHRGWTPEECQIYLRNQPCPE
jgi:WD40 repeat protein